MRPFRVLIVAVLMISLAGCAAVPADEGRTPSFALQDTGDTWLARSVDKHGDPGDGRSGVRLLVNGPEALALRLLLTERAEKSVDAQYYILHSDVTGHLLAGEMLKAADRGVRVRLLLDDMYTAEYDAMTFALTRHPNIEIRLFNPLRRGIGKAVDAVFDFQRINRRMHNKSMTYDNQVTIVGGRNIGDEYFSARSDSNYDDLDLLAAGPVVKEVSVMFDDYWNSPYAVPAETVIGAPPENMTLPEARQRLMALYDEAKKSEYGDALTHETRQEVQSGRYDLRWVPAEVMGDPPSKAEGQADVKLLDDIVPLLTAAKSEVVVMSAYFVPGERGTQLLTALARRGVRVTVLTNSMDSTDVPAVHGHYARYRKALLEAGVELWELRPDKDRPDRELLELGQSLSGLHGKAFAVDGRQLFIGSFNWDPRSANINTEMGILVESERAATTAVAGLRAGLPGTAYQLVLDDEGEIEWHSLLPDGTLHVYRQEPASSGWRRFQVDLLGMMPIGGLL